MLHYVQLHGEARSKANIMGCACKIMQVHRFEPTSRAEDEKRNEPNKKDDKSGK